MKNLFRKYPIIYLLLFVLLAFVAGYESGDIIKNGISKHKEIFYLTIFGIVINIILAFSFLFIYIKTKQNE